ncbi:hypothetical protein NIES2109_65110 (plasmid) [Nostoc sp. HK-01]|nr:hypothetical protein NIES2109_65110 [Nostoc sp. HK-01]
MMNSKIFSLQKNARPPNEEIKDKVATAILEHLVSEGKMIDLSSTNNAPYDSFQKINQSQS